jgi:hypothetical protein
MGDELDALMANSIQKAAKAIPLTQATSSSQDNQQL